MRATYPKRLEKTVLCWLIGVFLDPKATVPIPVINVTESWFFLSLLHKRLQYLLRQIFVCFLPKCEFCGSCLPWASMPVPRVMLLGLGAVSGHRGRCSPFGSGCTYVGMMACSQRMSAFTCSQNPTKDQIYHKKLFRCSHYLFLPGEGNYMK